MCGFERPHPPATARRWLPAAPRSAPPARSDPGLCTLAASPPRCCEPGAVCPAAWGVTCGAPDPSELTRGVSASLLAPPASTCLPGAALEGGWGLILHQCPGLWAQTHIPPELLLSPGPAWPPLHPSDGPPTASPRRKPWPVLRGCPCPCRPLSLGFCSTDTALLHTCTISWETQKVTSGSPLLPGPVPPAAGRPPSRHAWCTTTALGPF